MGLQRRNAILRNELRHLKRQVEGDSTGGRQDRDVFSPDPHDQTTSTNRDSSMPLRVGAGRCVVWRLGERNSYICACIYLCITARLVVFCLSKTGCDLIFARTFVCGSMLVLSTRKNPSGRESRFCFGGGDELHSVHKVCSMCLDENVLGLEAGPRQRIFDVSQHAFGHAVVWLSTASIQYSTAIAHGPSGSGSYKLVTPEKVCGNKNLFRGG